jgi:nitrate reductase NapAB chaperone NapD
MKEKYEIKFLGKKVNMEYEINCSKEEKPYITNIHKNEYIILDTWSFSNYEEIENVLNNILTLKKVEIEYNKKEKIITVIDKIKNKNGYTIETSFITECIENLDKKEELTKELNIRLKEYII